MKIQSKIDYAVNTYYEITAIDKNGDQIIATLTQMWDDNFATCEYDLTIVESKYSLTNNEVEELKELAIEYKKS